ncbi:hypothetical protein CLH62_01770 [Marinobacter guineae]|uniref:Glycosyltransferase 2-like domain-containing protein n=1 Tax=Marinobacter guineae TaxID=432303 RepID=A0A2G1VHT1_9GAMM|nr:glycosyltransferase family A protein [Marinobacter guineae]PHQ26351.1 hypothetical protein CLH62_01770 [Marinobacter guineae]
MEWPLVSIIIPTFNRTNVLVHALNSIDYENYEAIVVDDGSTPPVRDTLDLSQFPAVKLITKPNGGISSARARAQEEAKGEYIAYLDSDDEFAPGKLQKLVALMEEHKNIHFAFHDITRFRQDGDQKIQFEKRHSDFFPNFKTEYNQTKKITDTACVIPSETAFYYLTSGTPIFPSSVVIRKSILSLVEPWNEKFLRCQDMEYFARVLCHTDALYINEPLTAMGIGEDNNSKDPMRQLTSDTEILLSLTEAIKSRAHKKQLAKAIQKRFRELGWHLKQKNRLKEAANAYRISLREKPSLNAFLNLALVVVRSNISRY